MDGSLEGFAFEMGVKVVDRGGFVAGELAPDFWIGAGVGQVGHKGVAQGMGGESGAFVHLREPADDRVLHAFGTQPRAALTEKARGAIGPHPDLLHERVAHALVLPQRTLRVITDRDDSFLAPLATHLHLPGEQVVREGEPGEELFVVMEGEADVVIKTGDQTTPVATLKKGQFFGEMSLLTGAPRSATVQTKSPLAVTVIGKHAMSRVLSGNPGLADQFGAILTARQSELATTRETADRAARLKSGAEDGKSLTARILKFFRLSGN